MGSNTRWCTTRKGRLVDGRHRLAARELAGVEPTITMLPEDVNAIGYITSANIRRRNMIKGQTAIVVVRAFSDSENRGRDPEQQATRLDQIADIIGIGTATLGHAKIIAEFASDLADHVLAGTLGIDAAYDPAKDRRNASATRPRTSASSATRRPTSPR